MVGRGSKMRHGTTQVLAVLEWEREDGVFEQGKRHSSLRLRKRESRIRKCDKYTRASDYKRKAVVERVGCR